jgi:hypothetical protein
MASEVGNEIATGKEGCTISLIVPEFPGLVNLQGAKGKAKP